MGCSTRTIYFTDTKTDDIDRNVDDQNDRPIQLDNCKTRTRDHNMKS